MKNFLFTVLCFSSISLICNDRVQAEALFQEDISLKNEKNLLIDNSNGDHPVLFFSQADFDKYEEVVVTGNPLEIFLLSDISVTKPIHIVNVILNGNPPVRGSVSKACLTIFGSYLNHENAIFKNISLKNSGSNTSF